LKELFKLPVIGQNLIFKGGTSLSKIFKVINSFSEDIDVSIERGFLGYGGTNEPEAGASNKEKQRRVEALMAACQHKIATEFMPALNSAIHAKIPRSDHTSLRSDETDPDKQTLLFDYPSSLPPAESGYVRQSVKVETGARSDHWPCETKPVTPYVAEQFPQGFRQATCEVKVLSVERTFWEKATILHAEFHRPESKPTQVRLSRHYCDFYELIRNGVAERGQWKE
jgi:Nucleotidyl transferase AbiEii toxin, Type IV TA system